MPAVNGAASGDAIEGDGTTRPWPRIGRGPKEWLDPEEFITDASEETLRPPARPGEGEENRAPS